MDAQSFFDAMRFFGEPSLPDNADKTTIYGAYARALSHYGGEVLQRAADGMLATRSLRKFPLLAECLDACRGAQDEIAGEAKRTNDDRRQAAKSGDPWSQERVRLANGMISSGIGRQAAAEGWIISLHDFCREQARLPNKFEAEKVRSAALARKAERERREREFGGNPRMIQAVAKAMEAKRARLSALANEAQSEAFES
jgi:hypothetical protein